MTRVNMGTQDIQGYPGIQYDSGKHGYTGYTRYTVLLG